MSRPQKTKLREKVSLIQLNAPAPMLAAFNEQASEEALIGAVLQNPDVFALLAEQVQPSDFGVLFNGYAWHAFDTLTTAGSGVDLQTVADAIEHAPVTPVQPGEALPRLIEMMARCPDVSHAGVYAARVLESALRLRILKATEDIRSLALDKTKRQDDIIDGVDRLIYQATARVVDESSDARTIAGAYYTEVENAINNGITAGTPFGFPALDERLGGLMPGHVVVVAAPAGAGKTTLALSLIRQMVGAGKRMALFSLEMSKTEIVRALIAMEAPLDRLNLMAFKFSGNGDFAKFVRASGVVSAYTLDIIDEYPQMTPLQLRRRLRRLCASETLDVVFVDGLWLMNADEATDKRNEDVMSIMKALMEIARDFQVPIVLMHQLNREATKRNNKEPQLNDLAESIGVSQTAVMVMALYRPTYYEPDHLDTGTYLRVLKSRFVNANGLRFVMDFDPTRECYTGVRDA